MDEEYFKAWTSLGIKKGHDGFKKMMVSRKEKMASRKRRGWKGLSVSDSKTMACPLCLFLWVNHCFLL